MPETVTLEWIGRTLMEMRQEQREFKEDTARRFAGTERQIGGIRGEILSLREQFTRLEAAQIRLEHGVTEAIRHLRAACP